MDTYIQNDIQFIDFIIENCYLISANHVFLAEITISIAPYSTNCDLKFTNRKQ